MSFSINNETWVPESTQEHAQKIMLQINTLLQENNITDDNGEIIQLSANFANAFYLLALASGNRLADMDEKLSAAINSFNIELCDDQQIENLLPIAAISRNTGSHTTLNLTVTASESGNCTIPAGTRAPFGKYFFVVETEAVISAGSSQVVPTKCNVVGPVSVLTGEVTAFENSIANLEKVENLESSVPGVPAETTNELRQRLIRGNVIKYSLDGCRLALEELTGIFYARVYFNFNNDDTMTLPGGIIIQPRTAYIVVYGDSDDLAKTYAAYMNAPTQNAPGKAPNFQNYVTNSGQTIPIYFDHAEEQLIYVKVVLQENADDSTQVENQIKRDLLIAESSWTIGQNITSLTTAAPFIDCTYTDVAYTLVSTDGITWSNSIEIAGNVIPRIKDETIEVETAE